MHRFGKAWRRGLLCAAAASAIGFGAAPARADYFYTDLGTLPGYTYSSFATAISPDGSHIAGYSTNFNPSTGTTYRPWVWSDGALHDLGNVLGGALYFRIGGVNDSGQVVGTDYYSNGSSHTFITSSGGSTQSLDSLGTKVQAFDINDSGQVVGEVDGQAFIWTPGSGDTLIPHLTNGGSGDQVAWAINDNGQVAGWDTVSVPRVGAYSRPFEWSAADGLTAIPLAGPNTYQAQARAISESGLAAGNSLNVPPGAPEAAFLWTMGLGTSSKSLGQVDAATGVDSLGEVVGNDGGLSGLSSQEAFIWSARNNGSPAFLLNTVTTENVLNLRDAEGVSDNGQIVGFGTDSAGAIHAYLLAPPGALPGNPLLPSGGPPYSFTFTTAAGTITYIDPQSAAGYDYILGGGSPFIDTAVFPTLPGDPDGYDVFALTDLAHPLFTGVMGGTTIDFTTLPGYGGGIDGFALRGIDPGAGVDPNDPLGFVTGLTFVSGGTVSITQSPITFGTGVPEPGTWLTMLIGVVGLGAAARAARRRPALA
jgi:probable HAF family extracellular repeat protein